MRLPLKLGPIEVSGYTLQRSGLRWLCDDGHACERGEVIAYCNVGLTAPGQTRHGRRPFMEEGRDFQIAFATRTAGRLRRAADVSRGGFLDQLQYYSTWDAEFAIGELEVSEAPSDGGALDLLMLAGRRATELAEVRSGLLTGWHDRSRAWWGQDAPTAATGTLLSLGICDQAGILRGERFAFTELFAAVRGPAQAVFVPDDALVPCASVLADQLARDSAAFDVIAADFARTFGAGTHVPAPADWIFAGSLLSALRRSPLTDRYDVLTRGGLTQGGPPDAVLLSLNAEWRQVLRHRRLGYYVQCHVFRIAETGPAVREWLRTNFEVVERSLPDVLADYERLVDRLRTVSSATVLVMNAVSSSGSESTTTYAGFEGALGEAMSTVRAKEMNLLLHDLARSRNVAIVDADAVAADVGCGLNAPDGVHFSGPMQALLRDEVVDVLRRRNVPGFAPRYDA
jgi:hypothetical protein